MRLDDFKTWIFALHLFNNVRKPVRYRTVNSFGREGVIKTDSLILNHASAGNNHSSLCSSPCIPGPDGLPFVPVKILRDRLRKMWRS